MTTIPLDLDDGEVERVWLEFWEPLVCQNGVLDLEQIKRELYDFWMCLQEVPAAYVHVTGGKISKPHTRAVYVMDAADEHYARLHTPDDALKSQTGE